MELTDLLLGPQTSSECKDERIDVTEASENEGNEENPSHRLNLKLDRPKNNYLDSKLGARLYSLGSGVAHKTRVPGSRSDCCRDFVCPLQETYKIWVRRSSPHGILSSV